jgi:hypothetical protein
LGEFGVDQRGQAEVGATCRGDCDKFLGLGRSARRDKGFDEPQLPG